MHQIMDLKLETETLKEMKQRFEEEKRIIIMARKDITAINTLLDKMKQLPIISGINTTNELVSMASSSVEDGDGQLAKLKKGLKNYNTVVENLTFEINTRDQQLEEKRERHFLKETTVNLYNKVHGEVECLTIKRNSKMNLLRNKEEEMILLANNTKLNSLDIEFIENRLFVRDKLFDNYIKSNKPSDEAIKKITAELGNHIEDIKKLTGEFIIVHDNPDLVHDLVRKIKEKESILDMAAGLLKKFDEDNKNLQELFDAIRLNNMTNIFEIMIKNFERMAYDMAECKEEIKNLRSDISDVENLINKKNEHLDIMLNEIMTNMKTKPLAYPNNGNNKDLLDYFTNLYTLKKENQMLKTLVSNIKDKGTEVIDMCRDIINYQEKENQKLTLEISAKADVVKQLQEKYSALHREVHANSEIIVLQSKLVDLMEENEHLLMMNAYFKSQDAKLSHDVKNAEDRITDLENDNDELYECNTELMHSNTELREKLNRMEKYVEFVQRNLMQLQFDEAEDAYSSHDSDDSFLAF